MSEFARAVLGVQGVFYVITGLWPLVSMATFERVTGPKVDHWLVRTVGLLAAVIGASLLTAAGRAEGGPAVWVLALGAALAFAAVDLVYVAAGRISRVYLLDAAAELVLAVLLSVAAWSDAARPVIAYPRMTALAEVVWTPKERKDFVDFSA